MDREERLELAKKLINEEINSSLSMWKSHVDIHTYAWGWLDKETVGNNHGNQFFYADEVIGLVKALRLSYTLTVRDNCDGEPTAAITIF